MKRIACVLAALLLPLSVGSSQEPKKGNSKKPEGVQLRAGVVRDRDGKDKAFEFIRGVPVVFGGDAFDEKHGIFFNGKDWFYVPLADLAVIEIGKQKAESPSATPVQLKAKDGKQQTLAVDLQYPVEVKWKGDIAITRTQWKTFEGGTITFDK